MQKILLNIKLVKCALRLAKCPFLNKKTNKIFIIVQSAQLGEIRVFNKKIVDNVEKLPGFFEKQHGISKIRFFSTRLFHIYNIFCVENFFGDFLIFYIFSS